MVLNLPSGQLAVGLLSSGRSDAGNVGWPGGTFHSASHSELPVERVGKLGLAQAEVKSSL
jgi:hypothetical protein